jgi:hypothetical protein
MIVTGVGVAQEVKIINPIIKMDINTAERFISILQLIEHVFSELGSNACQAGSSIYQNEPKRVKRREPRPIHLLSRRSLKIVLSNRQDSGMRRGAFLERCKASTFRG